MHPLPQQTISDSFAAMWFAAGQHLSRQMQDAQLPWLKHRLELPMLEHLSFRLGNQLFFVRLEDVEDLVHGPANLDGLLTIARRSGGHPCVMRMRRVKEQWHTTTPGWGLVDAGSGTPVDPPALVTDERIEMTDWEVHDFAVQVVRDHLEGRGRKVFSSQGNPHVDPAIWFEGDAGAEWVVVRAVRQPVGDVPVPENWQDLAHDCSQQGHSGSLAPVAIASASDDHARRTAPTPLWRGHPMIVKYEGLVRVHVPAGQAADRRRTVLFWPTFDDDAMAAACREALDIPRDRAQGLGRSAVAAIEHGGYRSGSGAFVNWRTAVEAAVASKISLPPDGALRESADRDRVDMRVTVANDTTLSAAHRLVGLGYRVAALNFANGIEPGGGFLGGARAQEEVLCRSSALYATLEGDGMYAHHRARPRPDSTAWAILSPGVPVFRTDAGEPLDEPWLLSVITCAAPYAPVIGQPESGNLLADRIHRVLAIARAYDYDALVLGAWGCGAFGNDPLRTAHDFRRMLTGEFAGAFREVVFAIADWSPQRRFLGPFRDAMAGVESGGAGQF